MEIIVNKILGYGNEIHQVTKVFCEVKNQIVREDATCRQKARRFSSYEVNEEVTCKKCLAIINKGK